MSPSERLERREDLIARLAVVEADQKRDHEYTLGNGQPGVIEKVERELKRLIEAERKEGIEQHAEMKRRIGRLERIAYIGFGVLVTLNFLLGIATVFWKAR